MTLRVVRRTIAFHARRECDRGSRPRGLSPEAITALALYVTDYVVGRPELSGLVILAYLGPSAAFAPLWSRALRRDVAGRLCLPIGFRIRRFKL